MAISLSFFLSRVHFVYKSKHNEWCVKYCTFFFYLFSLHQKVRFYKITAASHIQVCVIFLNSFFLFFKSRTSEPLSNISSNKTKFAIPQSLNQIDTRVRISIITHARSTLLHALPCSYNKCNPIRFKFSFIYIYVYLLNICDNYRRQ